MMFDGYRAGLDVLGGEEIVPGYGVKDGRGYGPYGMGYYQTPSGGDLPFGPRGEKLPTPEFDFQPGPDGGYLHGRRPPKKVPPGVAIKRPEKIKGEEKKSGLGLLLFVVTTVLGLVGVSFWYNGRAR